MKAKFRSVSAALLLCLAAAELAGQTISSFSPTVGSVGDTITIHGSGFAGGDKTYFFNGKLATAPITSDETAEVAETPVIDFATLRNSL